MKSKKHKIDLADEANADQAAMEMDDTDPDADASEADSDLEDAEGHVS